MISWCGRWGRDGKARRTHKGNDEPGGEIDPDGVGEHAWFVSVSVNDAELGDYRRRLSNDG